MPTPPRYIALIPAAGVGARMESACPKQYLPLAGKPMLAHSVGAFLQHPRIDHVFVVVNADDAYVHEALENNVRLTVMLCGGKERSDSVLNGLNAINDQLHANDWVLVHDAARPGLNTALISRLMDTVGEDQIGGLLALPVVDTVKKQTGHTVTTLSREGLWLAQTPQMFRYSALLSALTTAKNTHAQVTDEASAMESMGLSPKLVVGHGCNTKITRPDDIAFIETYLSQLKP